MVAGRGNGTTAVDQVINRVVVCDGVPFGGGNLGDGDIFVSVCNGSRIAGFQDYLVAPVRVVISPVCDGDGDARCRVVEGVVGFVDDGGIIFYFRKLAIVAYYTVVAACDGGRAGGDIINITGEGGDGSYLINRQDKLDTKQTAGTITRSIQRKRTCYILYTLATRIKLLLQMQGPE